MAQTENTVTERQGKSFTRYQKQVIRIDMTPMVDLGFLLITFFVFTTAVSTPTVTDLYMPKEGDSTKIPDELALTLLLKGNNEIYYYHGRFDDALKTNRVYKTNYSTYEGIGKIIRQKQKDIETSGKFKEGRLGMMIVIKPAPGSVYKNLVDTLDEVMINDVKKYAIVEPADTEMNFLETGSRR